MANGKVKQVLGPVVDVEFDANSMPAIYTALRVTNKSISDKENNLVLEVAQHLGDGVVRTISMDSTDGLSRGAEVTGTGAPIQMPIGADVYGRLFNVIGDAIDGLGNLPKTGEKLGCKTF